MRDRTPSGIRPSYAPETNEILANAEFSALKRLVKNSKISS